MTSFEQYLSTLQDDQAVLLTSPISRRYVTAFQSSDGAVFAYQNKILLFLDMRYYEMATIAKSQGKLPTSVEILHSKDFKDTVIGLTDKGVDRIYFEEKRTYCSQLDRYKLAYPKASFLPFGDTLEKLRSQKTPQELEKIKASQNITEKAFEHALGCIREGMREAELALELDFAMRRFGAQAIAFETVCVFGSNTSLPHGKPGDRALRRGDFITMDFGANLDGYCSDMTRTVCFGKASEKQKEVYNLVLRAQLEALDKIKGNIKGSLADSYGRKIIEDGGYGEYFNHSLGHSLGLEVHESPNFSPREENIVPCSAVVSVEPGIYLPGEFGVRIEDIVYLTEDGCINLTHSPKELLELD
ncbi:MAG: aminopeptidase P family protein [Ruminococcaceae bacterium]|nr:aminopeptidase P family protein [Oscillospiraceae bacterium]